LKRQQELETQNAKADQSLGSDDSITGQLSPISFCVFHSAYLLASDNTMAMSMGGDTPQAPAAHAAAASPRAAAPKQHSDATIQMVKPLAAAAPVQNVRIDPPPPNPFRLHD
jgi:hypothetical protein